MEVHGRVQHGLCRQRCSPSSANTTIASGCREPLLCQREMSTILRVQTCKLHLRRDSAGPDFWPGRECQQHLQVTTHAAIASPQYEGLPDGEGSEGTRHPRSARGGLSNRAASKQKRLSDGGLGLGIRCPPRRQGPLRVPGRKGDEREHKAQICLQHLVAAHDRDHEPSEAWHVREDADILGENHWQPPQQLLGLPGQQVGSGGDGGSRQAATNCLLQAALHESRRVRRRLGRGGVTGARERGEDLAHLFTTLDVPAHEEGHGCNSRHSCGSLAFRGTKAHITLEARGEVAKEAGRLAAEGDTVHLVPNEAE
mmetsp:Transcript_93394/g.302322  ORF Transcript_93394/g.302322 Transcript_93394/m.302322 type:complete len:312 (+) Transcript_93394:268-1203(+)